MSPLDVQVQLLTGIEFVSRFITFKICKSLDVYFLSRIVHYNVRTVFTTKSLSVQGSLT